MGDIRLEEVEDGIWLATLDRPDRLNALRFSMFSELEEHCARLEEDVYARALILTGAGRGFCAGLDLDDAAQLAEMPAARMLREQERWAAGVTALCRLSKPVIAAVNGPAAGAGMALALAADVRLASPAARFNAAFVRIGLSGGDVGVSWLLPRIVGYGIASEILLTGRMVDAAEAADIVLVNRVVSGDGLLEEAVAMARMIASNSPFGVRLTKRVLRTNVDAPSLEAALEIENRNQVLATRTDDMSEALEAFLEKRPPRYTGT